MKNPFRSLSLKDLGFGILLFGLVIAISILQPSNKILAEFGEDSVDIKSSRYALNIPYDLIQSAELVDKPDMGHVLDGHDDAILQTGSWENDTWGAYTACVEMSTDNCIVLHLTDGRTFVISRRDNEETQAVFQKLQVLCQ